ncbi:MAG TPA: hypothetical protein VFA49_01940, partial [Chloroflexota bacterium]|nr:hypothetical protein [Chloroflexota bacterium]
MQERCGCSTPPLARWNRSRLLDISGCTSAASRLTPQRTLATPWYLTHDLLIRRLRDRGHDVTLVRNVTDVDDSILDYAREHELDYADLAAKEVKRFASEMA